MVVMAQVNWGSRTRRKCVLTVMEPCPPLCPFDWTVVRILVTFNAIVKNKSYHWYFRSANKMGAVCGVVRVERGDGILEHRTLKPGSNDLAVVSKFWGGVERGGVYL